MITGIDPKVDYVFKKLFGTEANVPILMDLLNAVLDPPAERRLVAVELRNPFNEKDSPRDKLTVVDVKARDKSGRFYTIEMQNYATPAYLDRVLYYWARLFSRQLNEGDDFRTLQATISISFVNDLLFPGVEEFHLDFQLRSRRSPELLLSELQAIHVIELPKFSRGPDELVSPLEAWCYFLKNGAEMETDALPAGLARPALNRAMEVLAVISQTELERERYEDALKADRDRRYLTNLARDAVDALQKANEKAEIAREEGLKKGLVGRIHSCQRLLKMTPTPIEALAAFAVEQLESQANALETQVESRG